MDSEMIQYLQNAPIAVGAGNISGTRQERNLMRKFLSFLLMALTVLCLVFAMSSCGKQETPPDPSGEHTHKWDKGEITKQATCEEAGSKLYTCDECGETKTEEIAALGHDFAEKWSTNSVDHWNECQR